MSGLGEGGGPGMERSGRGTVEFWGQEGQSWRGCRTFIHRGTTEKPTLLEEEFLTGISRTSPCRGTQDALGFVQDTKAQQGGGQGPLSGGSAGKAGEDSASSGCRARWPPGLVPSPRVTQPGNYWLGRDHRRREWLGI
jgi:hypothetical protein